MSWSADAVLPWFAFAAALLLIVAALGAALMRTLFAMACFAFVAAIAAAIGAAALGAPGVAMGLLLYGGGFVALMLMGASLLTTRVAKARAIASLAPGLVCAAVLAGAVLWAAPDIALVAHQSEADARIGDLALSGVIALVGGLAAYGLLGYGPRGVFSRQDDESEN